MLVRRFFMDKDLVVSEFPKELFFNHQFGCFSVSIQEVNAVCQ